MIMINIKNRHTLNIGSLYGWAMSQKHPAKKFEWIKTMKKTMENVRKHREINLSQQKQEESL